MGDEDDNQTRARQDLSQQGPVMGPIYTLWESSLERLRLLNYEKDYCKKFSKKPFNIVHFAIQGSNPSHQFEEFIGLSSWICSQIMNKVDAFKREEFDDPNTVVNKLMLVLRQLDFRSSFSVQKLKVAHGEAVCTVLDFLTERMLSSRGFQWASPAYDLGNEATEDKAEDNLDSDIVEDDDVLEGHQADDDLVFEETNLRGLDTSLDLSSHNILQAAVDPIEWKTELERVGPKLRMTHQYSANEWRSHVDQTLASKAHIGKVLSETQLDLQSMFKQVSDELNKMRMKEKYLSNQYNSLGLEYVEIKHRLEDLDTKSSTAHETVARLTGELSELSERLDELKESFESKDSGLHDTSPLVKIKAALQQVKAEIHTFDMRIGVVSHTLLCARTSDSNRLRSIAVGKSRQRHNKRGTKGGGSGTTADDNSMLSDD